MINRLDLNDLNRVTEDYGKDAAILYLGLYVKQVIDALNEQNKPTCIQCTGDFGVVDGGCITQFDTSKLGVVMASQEPKEEVIHEFRDAWGFDYRIIKIGNYFCLYCYDDVGVEWIFENEGDHLSKGVGTALIREIAKIKGRE